MQDNSPDKLTFIIYKDPDIIKQVINMLNENPILTKHEIYSKLSRRKAASVWKFLLWFNDEVNKELFMVEREIRSLFSFRKVDGSTGKQWEIERNYTINSYEIDGGYRVEILLR